MDSFLFMAIPLGILFLAMVGLFATVVILEEFFLP